MRLENKIALVTGASRGIGRQIALDFAKEGADVGINYLRSHEQAESLKKEIEAMGRKAVLLQADVSEEDQVIKMVDTMIQEFGRIDILVNNAGYDDQYMIWEMPVAEFDRMIKVNLRSEFLVTRYVVPHMLERKYGRIICLSSQLAQKGASGLSHYAASKGGVMSFAKSIARELAPYNILVNCVNPGPIETDILKTLTPEWLAAKKAELPLGRFGQVEEVSPCVVMLAAEPDGNIFVGQVLGCNSGDVI